MGWQLGREVEYEKKVGLEYEFMGSHCERETFTCAELRLCGERRKFWYAKLKFEAWFS